MDEKFNKNAKVEQLTKFRLSLGEENGLIVKDPLDKQTLGLFMRFCTGADLPIV